MAIFFFESSDGAHRPQNAIPIRAGSLPLCQIGNHGLFAARLDSLRQANLYLEGNVNVNLRSTRPRFRRQAGEFHRYVTQFSIFFTPATS
jgi:hypothetical protein